MVNFETICPFLSCANISETCVFFFSFVTLFCKWCFMGFSRLPFGRCGLPFGFHFRGPDPYNDLFSKRELRTAFTDATVPGPDDILSGRDEDEEGLPTTDPNLWLRLCAEMQSAAPYPLHQQADSPKGLLLSVADKTHVLVYFLEQGHLSSAQCGLRPFYSTMEAFFRLIFLFYLIFWIKI